MLTSVKIENFQSIYEAELQLKPFTVLVGASSSGKSAIVRALHLLANNKRGADFVSHSKATARVEATLSDGTSVAISRSTSSSKPNQYVLTPPPDSAGPSEPTKFTKLGGEAPEAIRGLFPPSELAIVRQFDPPFLLTTSGAEVARTLGSLTNVDTVFAAAREAARRKLSTSADVRATRDVLQSSTEALESLEDTSTLQETVDAVTEALSAYKEASSAYDRATQVLESIVRLSAALRSIPAPEPLRYSQLDIDRVRDAQAEADAVSALLQRIRQAATGLKKISALPDLPFSQEDIDSVRALILQAEAVRELSTGMRKSMLSFKSASADISKHQEALQTARDERQGVLDATGICPMCGQELPE